MTRISWKNDAKIGDYSSMNVLLQWLQSDQNYDKYKGGLGSGRTKQSYHAEIVELMKTKYQILHRKVPDVRAKIVELEGQFKKAMDWRSQTGQGILDMGEEGAEQTVADYMKKLSPYFDVLYPIMASRPSVQALATSENMGNDPEEHEDEITSEENMTPNALLSPPPRSSPPPPKTQKRKDPFDTWSTVTVSKMQRLERVEMIKVELEKDRNEREKNLAEFQLRKLKAEAEEAEIHSKMKLLMTRKEMKEIGVPQEEIDALFPLLS